MFSPLFSRCCMKKILRFGFDGVTRVTVLSVYQVSLLRKVVRSETVPHISQVVQEVQLTKVLDDRIVSSYKFQLK